MTIVFCFSLLTLIAVELHARWVMPKTIYIIDNAISGLLGNYSAVFWIKLAVWMLLLLVLIVGTVRGCFKSSERSKFMPSA